jgi:general secretion pathway protein I
MASPAAKAPRRMYTTVTYKTRMRRAGFTLIEVLVALAISAVGLMAAYRAAGLATQEHGWLRHRTLASWVAQNQLADAQTAPQVFLNQNAGEATQAGETYRWTQLVENTFSPRFRRVTVRVTRQSDPAYVLANAVGYVEVSR